MRIKTPSDKECGCGSISLTFVRLNKNPDAVHAGRFDCNNCGKFVSWASKDMTEFLERIQAMVSERSGIAYHTYEGEA